MFKLKLAYILTLSTFSAAVYAAPDSYNHVSGATVVEISKPNASGLSHNIYKDFNVSANGMILNNSAEAITNTSVGRIAGNTNIAGGAAKVILNEVISKHSSSLNGFIEVAGQKADVIVANPNGISCAGCSFVNTGRAILTTGTPVVDQEGSLRGFSVNNGNITIAGKGMSNEGNYVDLMAKAVNIRGQITADSVRVAGGGFDYNYVSDAFSSHEGKPKFLGYSIDVAQLGGIKANQIKLIGNASGVGVRNAGTILADNALEISNMGVITNNGTLSSTQGNTRLVSLNNLDNNGGINAAGNLSIISYGKVNNSKNGKMTANIATINFLGKELANSGNIAADQISIASVNSDGKMANGKISNNGTISGQLLNVYGGELYQSKKGLINADSQLNVYSMALNNKGNVNGKTLMFNGVNMHNTGSISATDALNVNMNGVLANTGSISSKNTMALNVGSLKNSCFLCKKGRISADSLQIKSPTIKNSSNLKGTIAARQLVIVQAD